MVIFQWTHAVYILPWISWVPCLSSIAQSSTYWSLGGGIELNLVVNSKDAYRWCCNRLEPQTAMPLDGMPHLCP